MRRDSYRDAATLAFVRYGNLKGKSIDEYKEEFRQSTISDMRYIDPALVSSHLDGEFKRYSGFFDDLYAVDATLRYFEESGREYISDAVRYVYMSSSSYPSHKDTVSRVRRYAITVPVSEKTVYKWLEMARVYYSKKRGLAFEVPAGFVSSKW